ncbi:urease accessory protein UreF [Mycolicibacterium agri]|uniref:Urease accessory protein UreF n=1 Tax=Mycolicibacterium agri TaxID=36811 RepID=A0A2A7MW51_MYCAG|nr:urease accessory UreF family protein [Mycolicibacterium agri]PEG35743.1 urease accessory protein UreF [Mycolicibacterium agri]GFG54160.1 urease accessory protein UreF [Mycolicibacterium agri]
MPAITTDPAVALTLWMQLHDSAFPAGRMVHSHGLEEWLATRPDADADQVAAAVLDYLTHSYAPLDAVITAAAWRAAPDGDALCALDELTASYKLFDNARIASKSSGRQLASAARSSALVDGFGYLDAVIAGATQGHCAVVEGALQAVMGITVRTAVLGSIRSMMGSMFSVAVRLGRLGPLHSQRIQARHAARIVVLADQACLRRLDDVYSSAPALEVSGMRHETRSARLFTT